jgi:hypothetical protein
MFSTVVFTVLFFVPLSFQQTNPLKNFCRLFGHQTAVVDRQLYIDGGLVNWGPLSASSINYTSESHSRLERVAYMLLCMLFEGGSLQGVSGLSRSLSALLGRRLTLSGVHLLTYHFQVPG